jgi:hypothetical protein
MGRARGGEHELSLEITRQVLHPAKGGHRWVTRSSAGSAEDRSTGSRSEFRPSAESIIGQAGLAPSAACGRTSSGRRRAGTRHTRRSRAARPVQTLRRRGLPCALVPPRAPPIGLRAPGALPGDDPRTDRTPRDRGPARLGARGPDECGMVGDPAAEPAANAAALLGHRVSGRRAAYLALYMNDRGLLLPLSR